MRAQSPRASLSSIPIHGPASSALGNPGPPVLLEQGKAAMSWIALLLLVLPTPAHSAAGGDAVPFPLSPSGGTPSALGVELVPDVGGVLDLLGRSTVRLTDVPVPGTARLQLELTRVPVDSSALELRVDGEARASSLEQAALSLWSGSVAGDEDSQVFMAFSLFGSRGWIRQRDGLVHLLAVAPDDDWSAHVGYFVSEARLQELGARLDASCGAERLPLPAPAPGRDLDPAGGGAQGPRGGQTPLLCDMAVETDWQYFTLFGDLTAAEVYATTLFFAVSDRFVEQADVVLRLVYLGLWDTPNDPWYTGDHGGNMCDMLVEFRTAWGGNIPNGGNLAHFVSGANLGGGCAYLDVLCSQFWGFAVSGNIGGNMPFPVQQGPLTWDFFVFAHETGHNFGSPHTHDFCPPLDQCAAPGPCHTNQICTNQGTNMSYCHTCAGGMNNITTYFHPVVAALMRENAKHSCLPTACKIGRPFCVGAPNSNGSGAAMAFEGTTSVSGQDLTLQVFGAAPSQFGLFFYGSERTQVSFGDGFLCVGGGSVGLFRFNPPLMTDGFGDADYVVDFTQPPAGSGPGAFELGSQWHFQFWYRDQGVSGFNFSNALTLNFCP